MGCMYAWATPEYLLDYMSLEQIFLYYDNGLEFEQWKAVIFLNEVGKALEGKQELETGSRPDKEKFYKLYGDKIKRPPKGGAK